MPRFVRENALTLFFLTIMAGALAGQAFSGLAEFNETRVAQGGRPVSLADYLTSSSFAVDVAENWQSEYLQFFLYIFITVWLVQRGSPESKPLDEAGTESDERQHTGRHARPDSPAPARDKGLRGILFSRSLGLVMGGFFLLAWLAQSIAGWAAFNSERLADQSDTLTWPAYVASPDFWNRTFQNWQSEFLAVASMAALSIYLRQRGSPESKPVGTPHESTGTTG